MPRVTLLLSSLEQPGNGRVRVSAYGVHRFICLSMHIVVAARYIVRIGQGRSGSDWKSLRTIVHTRGT